MEPVPLITLRQRWLRWAWLHGGFFSLTLGLVGIVLPLLPTRPLVLLAAFCFSRGSERCELWLLTHPRFGPMVQDWGVHHALPLRVKQLAHHLALSSLLSWWLLPRPLRWLPGACCVGVAIGCGGCPRDRTQGAAAGACSPSYSSEILSPFLTVGILGYCTFRPSHCLN